MAGDVLIRSVRPWSSAADTPAIDVLCQAGAIAALGSDLTAPPGIPEVDGGGGVLLPGLVAAHVRPRPGQAEATLARLVEAGVTLARVHGPAEDLDEVLAARELFADRARIQVVAFVAGGLIREERGEKLLDAAVAAGADLLGGLDPAGHDRDPVRHLDLLFELAQRHSAGIDLQLRDPGELGAFEIELICERVAALGMRGRVTLSHCLALSTVEDHRRELLAELLAEHGISVTTLATAWGDPLPLRRLRWAGVPVGLGDDGGDLLDQAWLLAQANEFERDDEVELCADVATRDGARALRVGGYGVIEGDRADLMVLAADSVAEAVRQRPPRTLVVHDGRVVRNA
ncbi:amidohydrolase family protein [Crossiella cryophila]|uniref:Cytosine/adenosine deaminase-related metal-dependent hydrolase n=1 Tax=Crossiella cryophila TaxID=43355 RepID=A0A7W7FSM3_9PSEU|nr:N-isopropylammelide isopropylaminohydrolase [Crossiella cryophila]MBB4675548.1 cytosine/adenosine deaminase-related metal-dependent hydrolase [Crossiella cryophila]